MDGGYANQENREFLEQEVVNSKNSGRKANKIRIAKHQLNLDIISLVTSEGQFQRNGEGNWK